MTTASSTRGIAPEDHVSFERRSWLLQRAAWSILALVLLGALAGLFGRGPLSHRMVTGPNEILTVEYERFLHAHAPSELICRVHATATLAISFPQRYVEAVKVKLISPTPVEEVLSGDRRIFRFRCDPVGSSTATVAFECEALRCGSVQADIRVENTPEIVLIKQFVYP